MPKKNRKNTEVPQMTDSRALSVSALSVRGSLVEM